MWKCPICGRNDDNVKPLGELINEEETPMANILQDCPLCGSSVTTDKVDGRLVARCESASCGLRYSGGARNYMALEHSWRDLIARIVPAKDQCYYISTRQVDGTYLVHLKGRIDQHAAMHVPTRDLADKIAQTLNT